MPNIFTPNGDGFNERFRPIELNFTRAAQMKIINRWGQVVYETSDPTIGWAGGEHEAGTFFWLVEGVNTQCQSFSKKGWLHLIR